MLMSFFTFFFFFSEPWESPDKNEKQVPGHLYATAIENLRPFTQYKARIKAANDLGTGLPSSVITVSKINLEKKTISLNTFLDLRICE